MTSIRAGIRTIGSIVIAVVACLSLPACGASMIINPEVTKSKTVMELRFKGKIEYDKNREYFPRTIIEDLVDTTLLTFRYSYNVTYGKGGIPELVALFNPANIIGCPIGEDTLAVVGVLEVLRNDAILKSYTAGCAFQKVRTIFSDGETMSELRKRGLIEVRDNIEAQMYADKDFLMKEGRR